MDAKELFHSDGKSTGIFHCSKCRVVARTKEDANNCCAPYICNVCGIETEQYWLQCRECRECKERENFSKKVNAAVPVDDSYEGWLYCEDLESHNEGYFESIEELIDYLDDQEADGEDFKRPEYAFAAKGHPPIKLNIEDIIESSWADDMYEDFCDCVDGKEEIQKALNVFWELNSTKLSYEPDYKHVYRIPNNPLKASES